MIITQYPLQLELSSDNQISISKATVRLRVGMVLHYILS